MCRKSDAVLLGAVGDPRYDNPQASMRPEDGLLGLRKGLGLFANLRPVKVYEPLVNNTKFKPEAIRSADFMFVRELTGGCTSVDPSADGRPVGEGERLIQWYIQNRK
jgi:3-isopropylmalate dehydrogenase